MLTLPELGAIDCRSRIPLASYQDPRLRQPEPNKTSVTWHYNGPPIAGVESWTNERLLRFIVEVDVPNHIARIGMDGLAYHLIVAPSGDLLQGRDLDRYLWHCANWDGNHWSMAIHIPIGTGQKPTDKQLATLHRTTDILLRAFKMGDRSKVFGHQEWPGAATACPGEFLMPHLREWRTHPVGTGTDAPVVVTPTPTPSNGLTIVHSPRITIEQFMTLLYTGTTTKDPKRTKPYSPAYNEATDIWNILTARGIDPAVWLAFFKHESQMGNLGVTPKYETRNAGNVRTSMFPIGTRGTRDIVQTEAGPFVRYWTWAAGADDWAERMITRYGKEKGLTTVEAALPVYAPSGPPDYNNTQVYINSVLGDIGRWSYRAENLIFRVPGPDSVYIRTGPKRGDFTRLVDPGFQFEASEIVTGEDVNGENRWAHLLNGEGFISLSVLERVL